MILHEISFLIGCGFVVFSGIKLQLAAYFVNHRLKKAVSSRSFSQAGSGRKKREIPRDIEVENFSFCCKI